MATDDTYELIIPTAVRMLHRINENIVRNLRQGDAPDLQLPDIFTLAQMLVQPRGEIVMTHGDADEA
ncbi:MAG: hypothetical protein CMK74_02240 [Pseudomonadales bacterium]|nr:hypothetical protein [Pseudomonadales bacterium]